MVLVDSSIWINYFNKGHHQSLDNLLKEDLVVTNDIILSELIPSMTFKKEWDILSGMVAIPVIDLDIDWDSIRKLQFLNLKNGVNRVGIPGLIIVQCVIQNGLTLWTDNKHFYLMNQYMRFDLY